MYDTFGSQLASLDMCCIRRKDGSAKRASAMLVRTRACEQNIVIKETINTRAGQLQATTLRVAEISAAAPAMLTMIITSWTGDLDSPSAVRRWAKQAQQVSKVRARQAQQGSQV